MSDLLERAEETHGSAHLYDALRSFRCCRDEDIEHFLQEKAVEFLRRNWCSVYLLVDEQAFDDGRIKPDPDQPGQYGCYDDATYLHTLADERDTPLATLADVLQRRWFAHEKSRVLHLWLAAVDLAPVAPKKRAQRATGEQRAQRATREQRAQRATPKKRAQRATREQRAQSDGYERWKIYLRGEGRSLSLAHLAPFAHLHPNAEAGVRLLSDFCQSQQNLQLYGFALSLDSNNAYAINTYFIAE